MIPKFKILKTGLLLGALFYLRIAIYPASVIGIFIVLNLRIQISLI